MYTCRFHQPSLTETVKLDKILLCPLEWNVMEVMDSMLHWPPELDKRLLASQLIVFRNTHPYKTFQ